MVNNPSIQL